MNRGPGGADWLRRKRFESRPHAGWLPGILFRAGLLREVRVWGLRFAVPRHLVDSKTRWLLRHGQYEAAEAKTTVQILDPSLPLVEFGGGLGVIGCLTNPLLDRPQDHVVVEMNPAVLPYLAENRRRNECAFEIVGAALAYPGSTPPENGPATAASGKQEGRAGWDLGDRYENHDPEAIARVTLKQILDARGWKQANVILDVEGMETQLVDHELDVLSRHAATLCVELHPAVVGKDRCAEIVGSLHSAGFRTEVRMGNILGLVRRDG